MKREKWETMTLEERRRWRVCLHPIKPGTVFRCNVNGAVMRCEALVKTLRGTYNAVIIDCRTGNKHLYGLDALQRCDITILEE